MQSRLCFGMSRVCTVLTKGVVGWSDVNLYDDGPKGKPKTELPFRPWRSDLLTLTAGGVVR